MKSSCYFFFHHSVLICPNLYSTNLRNSLRTCSILVIVLSAALKWACRVDCLQDNSFTRIPPKTPPPVLNDACLHIRCLAIDVLLFRAFASAGTRLPTRCLAMDVHVTIKYIEPYPTRWQIYRLWSYSYYYVRFVLLDIIPLIVARQWLCF
jgi:hypothetical protein